MRGTPVLFALAILAAACASDPPGAGTDLGPLADQAERVGRLIEEDRPCEAAEAARTLGSLAERGDLALEVRQAVTSFATSAEASVTCDPSATPIDASPPDTPADDDRDDDRDDDDDDDDDDDKPGRGRGRDNGNGRGNGDD